MEKENHRLEVRYLIKELSQDGLLKAPRNRYDGEIYWPDGYATREEAYEAIYEKDVERTPQWNSVRFVIIEEVRWVVKRN